MTVGGYAVITTAWGGTYKPRNVYRVKDFSVDAAMDSDTDQWSLTVGDMESQLIDVLKRDNEVRVQLFARDSDTFQVLQTGFADEIGLDLEGNLSFAGRDMTAAAVDSQAPPNQWDNARPDKIITEEAKKLKIGSNVKIQPTAPFKYLSRDGSESYWEFWYRLMRKRSMWLWAEPDGSLLGGFLNYEQKPTYRFGMPTSSSSKGSTRWIPVEQAAWKKTTSSRIGEIFVVGNKGDNKNFAISKEDKTIAHWIKRPLKIITDTSARTINQANATADEEIYDSIVGAVEWQLTVMDTGKLIRQNTMAEVNLPTIGLHGEFFVVGAKTLMDESGLYQVVRLREKGYALSKRTPSDPQTIDQGNLDDLGARDAAANLKVRWANCFVYAANNHHGPWAFKDFLAVLISMCECETGFRNVRSGGSEEHPGIQNVPSIVTDPKGWRHFQETFSNNAGSPGSPNEHAVGPMQLYSRPFKVAADKLFDPQIIDQYVGGRWNPCSNIQESAIVLRGFARSLEAGGSVPLPIDQIWPAVGAYNGGPDWRNKAESRQYVECVKGNFAKYLAMIEAGLSAGDDEPAGQVTSNATRNSIVQAAIYFASIEPRVHYTQSSRRMQIVRERLNIPLASGKEIYEDCSSFVTGLYFIAGAPDPNGSGYGGSGNTDTLKSQGRKISIVEALPGDLIFYDNPDHVTCFIGNGQVISHGIEAGPLQEKWNYRTPTGIRSYFD